MTPIKGVSEMMPKAFGVSAKAYDFNSTGEETILDYHKFFTIIKEVRLQRVYWSRIRRGSTCQKKEGIIATKKLIEKITSS